MRRHLVIGDLQVKPGLSLDHVSWMGQFAAKERPEVIVNIGDWADMEALSSYDKGKASAENKRYTRDLASFVESVELFMAPIRAAKGYKPRMVLTTGNHEARVDRYFQDNPALHGSLQRPGDYLKTQGWEVHEFLHPVLIDGVLYSHIHPRGSGGKVTNSSLKFGAPNARTMVLNNMCSVTAGHSPGVSYHVQPVGRRMYHGLILGSSYRHDESFMSPVGNTYWRGVVLKNRVHNGQYDPCFVSLNYLRDKFGGKRG